MKNHHWASTLPALSLTIVATGTQAQPPKPETVQVKLPPIKVEASSEVTGGAIRVDQVQRSLATDMADVLRDEPSVVIGGGTRNAQRIYLRGVEGSNLNISIDGARQGRNLHQHRGGIGGLDPDLLKRVEVITGPSADLGPGALGGAIQFETVDAQDLLQPGQQTGAILEAGYASADKSDIGSLSMLGQAGPVGLLAHVFAVNRQDYRIGGGGEVPNSAGQDRTYFFKASALDLDGHSLRLSAERNTSAGLAVYGGAGSDMGYPPEGVEPDYQTLARETYTLDHRFLGASPLIDWRFNLYSNDNKLENRDRDSEVSSEEWGGSLRNTASFQLGLTESRLTLGADYYSEDGISHAGDGSHRSNHSSNLGLFAQERLRIDRFLLSFGVRYDDFSSDYGPSTFSGDRFSPNIGLDIDLPAGFSTYAAYGEAVRGSGIIPVGWMANIDANTNINDGKPLQPEVSFKSEAGLRFSADGLIRSDDQFNAELALFNTRLENAIVRIGGGPGPVAEIANSEDTLLSRGYEIRARWHWQAVSTSLAFVSVDLTDEDGDPLGVVRRFGAPVGDRLVWDTNWSPWETLTLGYTLTAVDSVNDVPEDQESRPGYTLSDIRAEWQPVAIKDLTLTLAINNLFDRKYADQTSIINSTTGVIDEPGRDIRLAMSYRF
ncbi:TonB-dependent receptor domain-containing protein [Rhabdochromatium marinum]|uniref:TonB-dependent receptor domain-containing protein n=1 Tax=Rhabdochromatium marinum TaxID=48729 RepID=UPI001904241F|nr:TonB-dependent receptor [Rhabdochromatium marinum]MBK1649679.1 TonB-dependent receptor [Rhabdochromatium marinum]